MLKEELKNSVTDGNEEKFNNLVLQVTDPDLLSEILEGVIKANNKKCLIFYCLKLLQ